MQFSALPVLTVALALLRVEKGHVHLAADNRELDKSIIQCLDGLVVGDMFLRQRWRDIGTRTSWQVSLRVYFMR
jgi:hypothetical protein